MSWFPRWAHRLYAWFHGYYWLPCPRCNRMTGGHEPSCWRSPCAVGNQLVCMACCRGDEAHLVALKAERDEMIRKMVHNGDLQLRDTDTGAVLTPDQAIAALLGRRES